jgi:hypothetical protein
MNTLVGILRWKFIYGNWTKTRNHITVKQEIGLRYRLTQAFGLLKGFWDGSLKGMLTLNESEFREF